MINKYPRQEQHRESLYTPVLKMTQRCLTAICRELNSPYGDVKWFASLLLFLPSPQGIVASLDSLPKYFVDLEEFLFLALINWHLSFEFTQITSRNSNVQVVKK